MKYKEHKYCDTRCIGKQLKGNPLCVKAPNNKITPIFYETLNYYRAPIFPYKQIHFVYLYQVFRTVTHVNNSEQHF